MELTLADGPRISVRLRNALVADLVMEQLGPEGDRWLVDPLRDEWEWTEHLARQLGMERTYSEGRIHDTLLLVLQEVDHLLREGWPPRHDLGVCKKIAHEATKHLSPTELVATLLSGPVSWRRSKVEGGCRVDRLATQLQPLLEKALATDLHRVVAKWVEWDIRQLRDRRRKAIEAATVARAEAAAAAAPKPRVRYQRPQGRDLDDLLRPPYQPPGRT